jgi:hypothetical protein
LGGHCARSAGRGRGRARRLESGPRERHGSAGPPRPRRAASTRVHAAAPRPFAPLCAPPAGAVLSHANLVADAAGTCSLVEEWTVGDRHISYLPLAHIYERNNMTVGGGWGGQEGWGGLRGGGGWWLRPTGAHYERNNMTVGFSAFSWAFWGRLLPWQPVAAPRRHPAAPGATRQAEPASCPSPPPPQVSVFMGGSVGFYSGNVMELLDDVVVRGGQTPVKPRSNPGQTRAKFVVWLCSNAPSLQPRPRPSPTPTSPRRRPPPLPSAPSPPAASYPRRSSPRCL